MEKKFLTKYKINSDYSEFFNKNRIDYIENFLDDLEQKKIVFVPERLNIFKALGNKISKSKVMILGMDPYKQKDVATGIAFEVEEKNWNSKKVNNSLKNILKLIYFSYFNKYENINFIRDEIDRGKFEILPPNEIFKSWNKQGVILLNTALTTELEKSGVHLKQWQVFIEDLLKYITDKNNKLIYFLWGQNAQKFLEFTKNNKKYLSNHPAICGNMKNPKDFMNNKCFKETKEIINWLK